jgi:hypothetical protein
MWAAGHSMAVPLAVGCPASSANGGERKQMTFPASVYDGIWQRRVLADQLDFLSRTLGSAHSTERRVELPA